MEYWSDGHLRLQIADCGLQIPDCRLQIAEFIELPIQHAAIWLQLKTAHGHPVVAYNLREFEIRNRQCSNIPVKNPYASDFSSLVSNKISGRYLQLPGSLKGSSFWDSFERHLQKENQKNARSKDGQSSLYCTKAKPLSGQRDQSASEGLGRQPSAARTGVP